MKFILFLFYITICFKSFSQLTLVELKNILKMDLNKFETYALNRGYNFDEVNEEEKVFGHSYRKGDGDLSKYLTLYDKFYEQNRTVTYQTSETKEYLSFKNEIERDGFQLTKTENFEGTSLKFYSNSTYNLRIYVGKGEIADNVYEINLTRKIE